MFLIKPLRLWTCLLCGVIKEKADYYTRKSTSKFGAHLQPKILVWKNIMCAQTLPSISPGFTSMWIKSI